MRLNAHFVKAVLASAAKNMGCVSTRAAYTYIILACVSCTAGSNLLIGHDLLVTYETDPSCAMANDMYSFLYKTPKDQQRKEDITLLCAAPKKRVRHHIVVCSTKFTSRLPQSWNQCPRMQTSWKPCCPLAREKSRHESSELIEYFVIHTHWTCRLQADKLHRTVNSEKVEYKAIHTYAMSNRYVFFWATNEHGSPQRMSTRNYIACVQHQIHVKASTKSKPYIHINGYTCKLRGSRVDHLVGMKWPVEWVMRLRHCFGDSYILDLQVARWTDCIEYSDTWKRDPYVHHTEQTSIFCATPV